MHNKSRIFSSYTKTLKNGNDITVNVVPGDYNSIIESILLANIFIFAVEYILFFQNQQILVYLFIVFIIAVNNVVYYFHKKKITKISLYKKCTGTIQSMWIDEYSIKGTTVLCLKLSYEYKYNDEKYSSEIISVFENYSHSTGFQKIFDMVEEYTNDSVEVWVNPDNPNESVLKKTPHKKYIYMHNLILLFIPLNILNILIFSLILNK